MREIYYNINLYIWFSKIPKKIELALKYDELMILIFNNRLSVFLFWVFINALLAAG